MTIFSQCVKHHIRNSFSNNTYHLTSISAIILQTQIIQNKKKMQQPSEHHKFRHIMKYLNQREFQKRSTHHGFNLKQAVLSKYLNPQKTAKIIEDAPFQNQTEKFL